MNHLEKKMRYSNAFSSLNSLRNTLNDKASIMEQKEKEVILDAIEISIDKTESSFVKALTYGFYNTGETLKSSALELAKVFVEAINRKVINETEVASLRKIIQPDIMMPEGNEKELIFKIDSLMILLNKAKREDVPASSTLLIKSL
jgi:hypothetical protein